MQAQDAATAYFFKLWSWVEANLRLVVIGAGIVAVAVLLLAYYFWRQNQMEITAAESLTQLQLSTQANSDAGRLADAYLKIAADYPDTQTGERARVLGATTLFESGSYEEAQAQFQRYLNQHPTGVFSATAALGVAASLEAQGKIEPAAAAYQRVLTSVSTPNVVDAAKFALAQLAEQHGRLMDAEHLYEEVVRDNPRALFAAEAATRALQLRTKLRATAPSNAPPASFDLKTKP